jgi:hypothetical protein
LWSGELEAVWMPDERCRVLRRRFARREQLVHSRSRARLAGLELPVEERESVDAGIRHIEFQDAEAAAVERLIAQQSLE